MAAIAAPRLVDLLNLAAVSQASGFRVLRGTGGLALNETSADPSRVLSLDWPELERVLPDRGLPRGVIEIASPNASHASHASHASNKNGAGAVMRGGATTIALSAIRAVHANANGGHSRSRWCAWITESTAAPLYAPAVAQAGVDLDRLLVVRPEPVDLARAVVKVASSGAFDLVVIDAPNGLDGKLALVSSNANGARAPHTRPPPRVDAAVIIRKLALAAEERGTTFIVLTNLYTPRAVPWPVALRLEVERRPEAIAVRVTKDRRGRASSQHVVRVAL